MISEVVVLLAFLGFLCIRNEFVRRRIPFMLSIVFWGTARILMELNFSKEPTGELKYDWASGASVTAAACLVLCLFCLYWACWQPRRRDGGISAGADSGPVSGRRAGSPETPDSRIRRLVEEVDAPEDQSTT